jgi:hypothetical protein
MKKITLLFLLSSFFAFSQTDTTKVNSIKKEIIIKDTTKVNSIAKDAVVKDTIKKTAVELNKPQTQNVPNADTSLLGGNPLKLLVTANFGASFRLEKAKGDEDIKATQRDLNSGYSFDLGLYFRVNSTSAVGFKFNRFRSTGSITRPIPEEQNVRLTTDIEDLIYFYGPSFILDNSNSSTPHELHAEIAIGPMLFRENVLYSGSENGRKIVIQSPLDKLFFKGSSFGLTTGVGYKYRVSPKFSFGPQLNFAFGTISSLKREYANEKDTVKLTGDDKIDLTRIDLALGAVYRF